jgi:hypothetical protein
LKDERFTFALSLYHDALKEPNARFRIGRMFNVLEALAYQVKATTRESRKAVKQLLGLSAGATTEVQRDGVKYRFDAVEIAGRVRDKLFHGVPFEADDLNVESRPAYGLYSSNPEDIASTVSHYCELDSANRRNPRAAGRCPSRCRAKLRRTPTDGSTTGPSELPERDGMLGHLVPSMTAVSLRPGASCRTCCFSWR